MTYDDPNDEDVCQCINCRLSRMEKQISSIQVEFEQMIQNNRMQINNKS